MESLHEYYFQLYNSSVLKSFNDVIFHDTYLSVNLYFQILIAIKTVYFQRFIEYVIKLIYHKDLLTSISFIITLNSSDKWILFCLKNQSVESAGVALVKGS